MAAFLGLATLSAGVAQDLQNCAGTSLRQGIEAGEWAALNAAEAQFLGTYAGGSGTGGSLSDDILAQGTQVRLYPVTELTVGRCDEGRRLALRVSPLAAELPQGIGIFTDRAVATGVSLGLRAERFAWRPLGRASVGLGLGLEADWHRLHIRSALVDMTSESATLSLPVTLALRHPVGRRGMVELWLRQSWSTEGTQGQAVGLGYSQRY